MNLHKKFKFLCLLRFNRDDRISDGYSNADLIESIVAKNIQYQDEVFKSSSIPIAGMRTIFPFALGQFQEKIHVLDFGGGGGNHYIEAKAAMPTKSFIWNVLETKEMVKQCMAKRSSGNELFFIDKISDLIPEDIDLIIANSSLQYTEDPISRLRELIEVNSKYIWITRTVLTDSEQVDFYQTSDFRDNGPSISNPKDDARKVSYNVTVLPRPLFESVIKTKYDVLLMVLEERGVYKNGGNKFDVYGYFCKRKCDSIK
jgi:putative methyltransferase (TIGR04325 family)